MTWLRSWSGSCASSAATADTTGAPRSFDASFDAHSIGLSPSTTLPVNWVCLARGSGWNRLPWMSR